MYYKSSIILFDEYFMESNMLRYFYITFPMISWLRLSFLQTLGFAILIELGSKSLEFKGVYAFESQ